jgi:hypothetical protein
MDVEFNNSITFIQHSMSAIKSQHSGAKTKKIKKAIAQEVDHQAESSKSNKNSQKIDERFAKAAYDPKFMTPSSKVTKVKIDKRFSKMMNDPSFRTNSTIDRYGRKINPDEANN